jgi:hypothetical protein
MLLTNVCAESEHLVVISTEASAPRLLNASLQRDLEMLRIEKGSAVE